MESYDLFEKQPPDIKSAVWHVMLWFMETHSLPYKLCCVARIAQIHKGVSTSLDRLHFIVLVSFLISWYNFLCRVVVLKQRQKRNLAHKMVMGTRLKRYRIYLPVKLVFVRGWLHKAHLFTMMTYAIGIWSALNQGALLQHLVCFLKLAPFFTLKVNSFGKQQ